MTATGAERAYLGVGANLGDRAATIRSAVAALRATPEIAVLVVSPIVETVPVGPAGQPAYLNAAIAVGTTLSPRGLLDACLAIEAAHGRDRGRTERWGPRTLDLDVLLYGERLIDEPGLTIPHPHLHERSFVLEPLAVIAPRAVHPRLGRAVESLRDAARERAAAAGRATSPASPGS